MRRWTASGQRTASGRAAGLALVFAAFSSSTGLAEAPGLGLRRIEGAYTERFRNGLVGGEHYTSTDTLTIVHYGERAAYFDLALNFFNGHECALSGIAAVEGDALVYRAPDPPDAACRLEIRLAKGAIVFADEGNRCRMMSCGARGGYGGKHFRLTSRRPMNAGAIRRSDAFKSAVEAFEALPDAPAGRP